MVVADPMGGNAVGLTRVTRKGQVTIPKQVRDALRISQSDYVLIVQEGEKAILSPIRGTKIAELKGRLRATKPYPGTEEIRREVGRALGKKQAR